jgi:hypothetical protein
MAEKPYALTPRGRYNQTPRGRYSSHKCGAKQRGIGFEMTFDEWFGIWTDSGRWAERGPRRGQYVMARFGDVGPYAVGNVKIILHEANSADAHLGIPRSAETRKKLSDAKRNNPVVTSNLRSLAEARRGKPLTAEHIAKLRGPLTAEHRAKLSEAKRGKPRSPEARANSAAGLRAYYLARRATLA